LQNDDSFEDDNSEQGHAWTLAYRYELTGYAGLTAEWLQIHTRRFAWTYFDFDPDKTEQQFQFSLQLRFGNRLQMRAMHYDNRAEPTALERGQYAWYTDFDHFGMQFSLPADAGLIFQWMQGATRMGPAIDGIHVVDADYRSYFMLLTKAFGRHRLTARYDDFDVSQNDDTFEDDNSEQGYAWTLAYRYELTGYAGLTAEWLQIHTRRFAWTYFGYDPEKTDRQFQLSLQLRFGNRR
jgi:hypothetical protein